jgi:drug/metabolite transporter (DMT)-like permease
MAHMNKAAKGALYTVLSAVVFGFTPSLAKLSYAGGGNGITISFLRSVLCLPLLIIIMKARGIPCATTGRQFKKIAVIGVFGYVSYVLTLFISYSYIGQASPRRCILSIPCLLRCIA